MWPPPLRNPLTPPTLSHRCPPFLLSPTHTFPLLSLPLSPASPSPPPPHTHRRPPTRPTRAGKAPSTATTPPSRLLPRWPALLPSTTASATGRPARENATAAAGNDDDDDTAALLLPPRTRGGGFSDADPAGRSSSSYFPGGEDADEEDEAAAQAGLPHGLLDSTVKLFCVHTEPSFSMPWQRKRQFASTSTGFMVAGPDGERWLLTNAHAVEYGTQIKVKRRGDDTKFLATVLAAGTECDIALLSVADPEFWEGAAPLTLGGLPRLQEAVAVVGYPIGGDTISVTSGVVSRIEVTAYVHGSTELLGIQVSAAINSGNSGGPCFNAGGECVGVAFQSMAGSDAENIGYVIPTPVVRVSSCGERERENERKRGAPVVRANKKKAYLSSLSSFFFLSSTS